MPVDQDRKLAAEAIQKLTNELSRPSLTAAEASVLRPRLLALIDTINRAGRKDADRESRKVSLR